MYRNKDKSDRDFLSAMMEARTQCRKIFKVLIEKQTNKKPVNIKFCTQQKYVSKSKREIKIFSVKQKLKISSPADTHSKKVRESFSGFLSIFQKNNIN